MLYTLLDLLHRNEFYYMVTPPAVLSSVLVLTSFLPVGYRFNNQGRYLTSS
jgi:hypothetical protein